MSGNEGIEAKAIEVTVGEGAHGSARLEIPYATRKRLRQEHGTVAEAILDVLAHHHSGEGVEISHTALATEAGTTVSMTRRTIEKLCASSWIKRTHQVHGSRQTVNRYQIPTHVLPDHHEHPPAHSEQAPYPYTYLVDPYISEHDQQEEIRDIQMRGEATATPLDRLEEIPGEPDGEALTLDSLKASRVRTGVEEGARCARIANNIFTRPPQIEKIVSVFKTKVEQATGRPIRNQQRIRGFETSARVLLADHRRQADILAVIDFISDAGLLADVAEEAKITNLKQVRDDFDYFLDSAKAGKLLDQYPAALFEITRLPADIRSRLENHQ